MITDFTVTSIGKKPFKCNKCGASVVWIGYRTPKTPATAKDSFRPGTTDGKFHYCQEQGFGFKKTVPSSVPSPSPVPAPTVKPSWQNPFESTPDTTPAPETLPATEPEPAINPNESLYNLVRPFVLNDIDEAISQIEVNPVTKHEVHIKKDDGTTVIVKGQHEAFWLLLEWLACGQNVMLVGPAGTGKSTAAKNAAEALGLPFYSISFGPMTSKSDLMGYMAANGEYIKTVVYTAYTTGGILLLDEFDAGNAGVITMANAMLANIIASFPNDMKHKHPDCYFVAAANTYGRGATLDYNTRTKLDKATLSRFVILDWLYDLALERSYALGFEWWAEYVWKLREANERLKMREVFCSRRIQQGVSALKRGKLSREQIEQNVLWAGVSQEDKSKLLGAISN